MTESEIELVKKFIATACDEDILLLICGLKDKPSLAVARKILIDILETR